MEFRDYYKALGVGREASAEEIKRAYRKLARKYHPDVSKEKDAEARMQEVNEAYQVLSDPAKRAAYDRLGSAQPGQEFRPPPGWDSGFEFSPRGFSSGDGGDFSDFFEELFGRMGQRTRRNDHYAKVVMDLEDSLNGATRQISLRAPREDANGQLVLEERTLNVKIPKGVREGQVIRLAGQGAAGNGRAPGDLLLEVQFAPHPKLRADGRDLRLELPIAPWEAALGAVVPVELPSARLNVRVPPGARSGGRLRLRGKGLPSEPPGDLYLDLQIVAPPARTPKTRELYEAMARETAFDPRAGAP
jgi:curved DNA-binding protein